MTPRNLLDDKVIVDRQKLQMIVNALQKIHEGEASDGYPLHPEMRAFMDHFKQALAQDLAGWAAVPVVLTGSMFNASRVDYPMTLTAPIGVVAQLKWVNTLEASPPLPTNNLASLLNYSQKQNSCRSLLNESTKDNFHHFGELRQGIIKASQPLPGEVGND